MAMLQTEFDFTLPCGYVDAHGDLHRQGTMRLATARDEVEAMQDPRVRVNAAYLGIVLLSRVVTRLGEVPRITPALVQDLFAVDFAYLQELYRRINGMDDVLVETECPACGHRFALDLSREVDDESA